MKMVIKLLASHFDLTVLTEILIRIIKRFPSLAVQKFPLVWGNIQIHPYHTTLQQPLTETPKTVHS